MVPLWRDLHDVESSPGHYSVGAGLSRDMILVGIANAPGRRIPPCVF